MTICYRLGFEKNPKPLPKRIYWWTNLFWYVERWFYSSHLSGDVAEFLSPGFWGTNSSCCSCANKGFSTNRNAKDMLHEDVICTIYIYILYVYSLNTHTATSQSSVDSHKIPIFPQTRMSSWDVQYGWLQSLLIWNVLALRFWARFCCLYMVVCCNETAPVAWLFLAVWSVCHFAVSGAAFVQKSCRGHRVIPAQTAQCGMSVRPFLKISCQEGLDEDVNLLTYLHEAPEQTDLQLQKDLQRHSTGTWGTTREFGETSQCQSGIATQAT